MPRHGEGKEAIHNAGGIKFWTAVDLWASR